jgi:hypothetical protein
MPDTGIDFNIVLGKNLLRPWFKEVVYNMELVIVLYKSSNGSRNVALSVR